VWTGSHLNTPPDGGMADGISVADAFAELSLGRLALREPAA
jgi:hypothetical protein